MINRVVDAGFVSVALPWLARCLTERHDARYREELFTRTLSGPLDPLLVIGPPYHLLRAPGFVLTTWVIVLALLALYATSASRITLGAATVAWCFVGYFFAYAWGI